MQRATFLRTLIAGATLLLGGALHAQAQTDVQFYYPVAVGGPIAKTIDGFAADFMKANPSIKVTPIYAGTYQETIVKALTAHKSGTPPVTSVLLSTDMFTLIDEDAIVPFDNFVKTADDKAWLDGFYKAFMLNSQSGGKTWGIPFQRSTVVMYWNKELFKEAGLDPNKPPTTWAELKDVATKLTKKDAVGQGHAVRRADPVERLPVLAVPDAVHHQRRDARQRCRHAGEVRRPGGDRGAAVLGRPRQGRRAPDRRGRVGHHAEGLLREEGGDHLHHHRQPDQHPQERQVRLRRGDDPGQQAEGFAHRRRQLLHLQEEHAGSSRRPRSSSSSGSPQPERAAQWSIDTGYVAVSPAAYETATLKKYGSEFPPALVARDQLPVSVAEFSTHDNQRVTKALNDGLQAALTGAKPADAGDEGRAARGRAAAAQLQVISDARRRFAMNGASLGGPSLRAVHAWLMLLPALALLALFTHWPTLATLHRQLLLHAEGRAPRGVGGAGQLPRHGRRPGVLEGGAQQPRGSPARRSRSRSRSRW